MTGLCNVAWAFVRFGLPVPSGLARGIAEASNEDGNGGCMFPIFCWRQFFWKYPLTF